MDFRKLAGGLALGVIGIVMLSGCTEGDLVLGTGPAGTPNSRFNDPDVVYELTASEFEWEVAPGEMITVWGYNGTYPGPTVTAKKGDKIRVTLHNELPEGTTIHWHGFDVPWDQDGVDGLSQPAVGPGESWTYEFVALESGTHMYHSHTNSSEQVQMGLFGGLVIQPARDTGEYDHEYLFGLHEINGWYTINGKSFPSTMENDMMEGESGDRILIRMYNVGQVNHPMHLHGHQFEVVAIDGNDLDFPMYQNTYDIAPGMVVDVAITLNNPGTWMFHCHTLPHTTNRGVYPGGMVLMLDYTDHTSYYDEQLATGGDTGGHTMPTPTDADETATPAPTGTVEPNDDGDEEMPEASDTLRIVAMDFRFEETMVHVKAGQPVEVTFQNAGAAFHNVAFPGGDDFVIEARAGQSETRTLTFDEPGTYEFICSIPGHANLGMRGVLMVDP